MASKKKGMQLISKGRTDFTLVFVVVFLIIFGVIMVYSSSYYNKTGNHTHFFYRQAIWAVFSLIIMGIVSRIHYRFILKFSGVLYIASIGLLGLVLILPGDINGSKRWLDLGFMSFQPSEITKLMVILAMVSLLVAFEKHIDKWRVLFFILAIMLLPITLVVVENLSTGIILAAIVAGMLFVGFKSTGKIMIFSGAVLAAATAFIYYGVMYSDNYRFDRIRNWLDGPYSDPSADGFQVIQSLNAVGSGGFFGVGIGRSLQKISSLSEAHNDFIFAIVCEELGLFGALAVILMFAVLLWRFVEIIRNCDEIPAVLIVSGVFVHIGVQFMVNVAVVTNLIPATGVPLPFISYGGSSLTFLLVEIGIVLSIARNNYRRLDRLYLIESQEGITS